MNAHSVAGIDLGGTKIAVGVFDPTRGELIANDVVPTHAHEGPAAVMRRAVSAVQAVIARAGVDVAAVGLGVPAVIDYERGETLLMPNLPGDWYQRPIVAELESVIKLPVALINDARAFTLAEATQGAGKGASTVVCFTLGTGIGGGIAIDGRLHLGLKNAAGEFGHQTIEPDGPLCGCGNRGCLESLASGYAIAAQGIQSAQSNPNGILASLADGDLNRITPHLIMQAAEQGDPNARTILERAGTYIGIGIGNVLTILCADCVVLGGGVSQLGGWLLNPIHATLRARCHTVALDLVQIKLATLGQSAGVIGTAIWAHQQYQNLRS